MKEKKIRILIILLPLMIISIISSISLINSKLFITEDNTLLSLENENNLMRFQENPPKGSLSHNFAGYNESDFIKIYINESDIHIDSPVYISTTQRYLDCWVEINYPSSNTTWAFILPDSFSDATEYYIQRSYLEIFYCLDDNDNDVVYYVGTDTYWIIDGEPNKPDILHFKILVPTAISNRVYSLESLDMKVYSIHISRFDPCNRPYNNVILIYEIPQYFPLFSFQFFNFTGGINENITEIANYNYTIEKSTTKNSIILSLYLGFIKNRTDYDFQIRMLRIKPPPSFKDDIFGNIVIPFLMGISLAIPIHPYIVRKLSFLNKPVYTGRKLSDILKYGLPFGVIFGLILIGISYLMFIKGIGA